MVRAWLLLAGGLLALVPAKRPPAPSPTHFRLVSVASGVYAAIARPADPNAAGNAGFVVGEDAVLVIDSLATPAAAEELLAEIRRTTKLPVRWLVDTQDGLDHAGGNGVFSRAGAAILAHEGFRSRERAENPNRRAEMEPPEKAAPARLLRPDVTYSQALTVWLGSRRVEVLWRAGYTAGDSIVRVPDADVVFAGDLFCNATVPGTAGADTAAWQKTLEAFLGEFPKATFVPGHGEPGHALDVRFFRDYVFGLRQAVARGIEEGKSGQALVDAVLPLQRARFGAWAGFDRFAGKNIEVTEREMRGSKRSTPAPGDGGSRRKTEGE